MPFSTLTLTVAILDEDFGIAEKLFLTMSVYIIRPKPCLVLSLQCMNGAREQVSQVGEETYSWRLDRLNTRN